VCTDNASSNVAVAFVLLIVYDVTPPRRPARRCGVAPTAAPGGDEDAPVKKLTSENDCWYVDSVSSLPLLLLFFVIRQSLAQSSSSSSFMPLYSLSRNFPRLLKMDDFRLFRAVVCDRLSSPCRSLTWLARSLACCDNDRKFATMMFVVVEMAE
jgi:hypothetical protein